MKRIFLILGLILLILTFSNILWADEWVELFPTTKPSARYGHTMVEIDGDIYLFGGMGNPEAYNDLWMYDPYNEAWTKLDPSSSPPARHGHSAAVWNGKMYIFFGKDLNGNALSDVWVYDPTTNTWSPEPTLIQAPSARFFHTSVTLPDGRILVFGGEEPWADVFVWTYDPVNRAWEKRTAPPPYTGSFIGQTGYVKWNKGQSCVFGGIDNQGPTNTVAVYDPDQDSWEILPKQGTQPSGRLFQAGVDVENKVYISGGYGADGTRRDTWEYNETTNTWTQRADLPIPLSHHAAAPLPSGIIVFGGLNGYTPTDRTFEYTPTPPPTVIPGKKVPEGYSPGTTLTTTDPISAGGGEFRESWSLLSLGGPIPLDFRLLYAPDLSEKTPTNDGRNQFPPASVIKSFTSNSILRLVEFEDRSVTPSEVYINVLLFDDLLIFKDDGSGNFQPLGPKKYQIQKKLSGYYYLMDPYRELVYIFRSDALDLESGSQYMRRGGEVLYIIDRNNNMLSYAYNADRLPTRIEDGLGRRLDFTYVSSATQSDRHLLSVADGYGRTVGFTYENLTCGGSSSPTLTRFTDPMGQATNFEYDTTTNPCYRIQKINRPLSNSHIDQRWTKNPQNVDAINSQKDVYGNETTLSFSEDAQGNIITTVAHPDTTQRVFHHEMERYPLDVTDETNKKYTMSYNADSQPTSLDDRLGDSTGFTYHAQSGKIGSITNAKGNTITYAYTAQDQIFTNPANSEQVTFTFYNLTQITLPNPTTEQFTYDAKGNMVTRIDRAGKTWTYTYNGKGQVLTITNPSGGVTTYAYNNDGTLASSRDSDIGTTTYAYDTYNRLNQITRPDGKTIQIAYNLNDQITSITDENNHIFTYQYDANGNLTKITDPAGKQTQYAYDLMDRVTQATDRLNKVSTLFYNNMERLQSFTNPNNIATGYGYDTRGWLNSVTLGGQTWTTGYDDEGIVTSRKTPLNNTTTYQSDKLGFITGITNPLNQTTTLTRDALSRITGITDPLNRTTTYGYDSRGLLSGVAMPVIGTATYQRNDLGFLSQITDLNNNNWTFGYTNMGRPNSNTDPLGNTWNQTYDTRGRSFQTTYPDGSTLTRTYDDAGNLTRMLYSGGPDIQSTYNELNMLTGTNGITFTRDNENRITATDNPGTVFGATYDDGGRLKTATYPSTGSGQAFTVTYTYDSTTGLLSRVTDNLTNTQIDFTYDNDRRMIGITRSNGVNTTLTWDNTNRLTRIQDGPSTGAGFIDLQYTLNAAGQIIKANMTVPLDPASLLQIGTDTFTYDAASQVSTAGYTYDQRGRQTAMPGNTFSWDGASRLTGINSATLAYNGQGDLITRTESGNTIHYYYNYAIGLNPIVAEKDDSTGQFLRYYIWTPGGKLLYMIDAANSNKVYFYHFDLNGSTLALTDSSGTVTDKYAYDPYGELLAHQGSNTQPFTFVGELGVRHEGPTTGSAYGTLYHMRARYYDAVTQRFISREPVWPQIGDSMLLNPYQYAKNEPVGWVDFTGEGVMVTSRADYAIEVGKANQVYAIPVAQSQQTYAITGGNYGLPLGPGPQEPVITPSASINDFGLPPSLNFDILEEMSVTAEATAEYGRGTGAVINIVTRGGRNKFSGLGIVPGVGQPVMTPGASPVIRQRLQWVDDLMREWDQIVGQRESGRKGASAIQQLMQQLDQQQPIVQFKSPNLGFYWIDCAVYSDNILHEP